MSTTETIVRLGLAAVLAAFLYYKHWQRVRQRVEPPDPQEWNGKAFDASGIVPRIEKVRKNYLEEKHPPKSHFRRGLLAFARQAVSHLAFFQDRTHAGEHNSNVRPH
jgi:hypothetical protein